MTATQARPGPDMRTLPTPRETGRARFPARPALASWPATAVSRGQLEDRLARAPFTAGNDYTEKIRRRGLAFLLDWLEEQPGTTWQERWLASGSDMAGTAWRGKPGSVAAGQGHDG